MADERSEIDAITHRKISLSYMFFFCSPCRMSIWHQPRPAIIHFCVNGRYPTLEAEEPPPALPAEPARVRPANSGSARRMAAVQLVPGPLPGGGRLRPAPRCRRGYSRRCGRRRPNPSRTRILTYEPPDPAADMHFVAGPQLGCDQGARSGRVPARAGTARAPRPPDVRNPRPILSRRPSRP